MSDSSALHKYKTSSLTGEVRVYTETGWPSAGEAILSLFRQRYPARAWTLVPSPRDSGVVELVSVLLFYVSTVSGERVQEGQVERPEGYFRTRAEARAAAEADGKGFQLDEPADTADPTLVSDVAHLKADMLTAQANVSKVDKGYRAAHDTAISELAAVQRLVVEQSDRIQRLEQQVAAVIKQVQPARPPQTARAEPPPAAKTNKAKPAKNAGG